jgi:hypothetical protein
MDIVYMNSTVITFTLIVGIFGILLSFPSAYALPSATAMNKPTSGGSLNVVLQPSPDPVVKGAQTNLKVIFDQKGTSTVQPHIDYDVTISKGGKQLLDAVTLAGQQGPSLHTSDGIITIPYTFQEPGSYSVKVTVFGILFNPINPEFVQFQVNVT